MIYFILYIKLRYGDEWLEGDERKIFALHTRSSLWKATGSGRLRKPAVLVIDKSRIQADRDGLRREMAEILTPNA